MSDRSFAEDTTHTTHNKHKRQTFMPSAGFEPAAPAIKELQKYVLERTASGFRVTSVRPLKVS